MDYKKFYIIILSLIITITSTFSQVGESSDLAYGIKLYNDKIYDVAITQFKSFLEDHPNSISAPQAQFFLAEAYILLDDNELALKNYQKLVLNYPKSDYCEKSLIKTAEIHFNNNNFDKAARYYLQVKNYFPKSINIPENSYKAISIFFDQKLYDEAKENIALLNRNYPINRFTKKGLILLAKINEDSKLLKIAKRNYIELLRSTKESEIRAEVLYNFSLFLLRTKNLVEAKKYLLEVIDKYKKIKEYYFASVIEYANILINERKFTELETLLKYSTKNIPDRYKTKITVLNGDIRYYKKKYEESIELYEKAKNELVEEVKVSNLNIDEFVDIIFKLSYSFEALREYETAALQLDNILLDDNFSKINRKNAIIRSADLYIKASDFDKAIFTYKLYIDNFSKDELFPKLTYLIGKAYYENKKYEFAYETFKYFKREFSNSAYIDDVIYLSAESSMKLKKYVIASEDYKLLIEQYSASNFYPIAKTRLDYLMKYRLYSTNLMSKIAELSSRGLLEDDKTKLFLDWGKFYFYDLKDFVMAISFFEKYESNLLASGHNNGDREGLYLYAKAIENLTNANKKQLDKALSLYDFLISNKNNEISKWFILSYINKIDLFSKLEAAGDTDRKKEIELDLLLSGIGNKIDDENGTILYKYSKMIYENKDFENSLNMLSKFIFKYNMNSVYSTEILYLKATVLEKLGKYEEALSVYVELAENKEGSSLYKEISYLKLVKLLPVNKFKQKLSYLNQIRRDYFYTNNGENIEQHIADLYKQNHQLDNALNIFLTLEESSSEQQYSSNINGSSNLLLRSYNKEIADIYFEKNDFNKSEFYYRKELSRNDDNLARISILKKLSSIYKNNKDLVSLENNLKEISKYSVDGNNFEADLSLADIEFEKENYSKSLKKYTKLLKDLKGKNKDEEKIVKDISIKQNLELNIIKSLFRLKKITEGTKKIKSFRKRYSDEYDKNFIEPIFYLEKADALTALKKWDKALKAYEALLDEYEKSNQVAKALYGKALVLYSIDKKDEAFEIWTEIMEKYPNDDITIEVSYYLGSVFMNEEKFDEAIKSLQIIVRHNKTHNLKKYAYKQLIDLYRKLGFNDAAAKMIREYIDTYPDEDDVFLKRIEIGNIYQANEEFDTALDYFKRLLYEAKGEDESAVQFYIAETYMKKKQFRKAISEFLKVKYLIKNISVKDWAITSVYKSAICYEQLGEMNKAKTLYEEILKKYPTNTPYGRHADKMIKKIDNNK